ncbi:Na+/H+ antiporter subunit A [Lipingzhangella sp. LS1_29]|uniref:Na+/H+ antiporter subunit A n=1 Tax=Lipingzhangella rawalii TaxID=2055835 RepID=A0ABU2H4T8_9ACTN|nr:Na+/H+ antiporter subunit A [Lipingzhangella rawalii]MDS1269874.1 Na+/H+ antiporter subunit A [Lipingzhangella rawalii]
MGPLLVAHFVLAAVAPLLVFWWGRNAFLVLAALPAGTALWALWQAPQVVAGPSPTWTVEWAPAYHLVLALRMDVLSLVMTVVVTGFGALVLVYCARYFTSAEPGLVRFAGVMVAFAGSMLGLVLADDLVILFVFWELTSVFSYLLIGHDAERRTSRRAATTAFTVTTLGGLTMLVGVVIIGETAGDYRISHLVSDPPAGAAVTVAVALLLVGALSKSALLPFSLWLPAAMAAPTPVSAYLHAAAMVQAGVYLVARLAPAFSDLLLWQLLTVGVGTATMVLAGWKALRQNDLKLLLAYGTVSQLGFLIATLGRGTDAAAFAGLALLLAHALFKAPLFLVTGIVDHGTGTRDLRHLSGLWRAMPATFGVALVATASMAGLPPLAGFVAKEAVFEAFLHPARAGSWPDTLVLAAMVLGSAFTVGYSARFLWGAFADKRDLPGLAPATTHGPGPLFLAPALLLAVLCLFGGPFAEWLSPALAGYATTPGLTAAQSELHLDLVNGVGVAMVASAVALAGGLLLFRFRARVARLGAQCALLDADAVYRRVLRTVDTLALQVTGATQRGSLPLYLGVVLLTLLAVTGIPLARVLSDVPAVEPRWWDSPIQVAPALIVALAALGTLIVRQRLFAVVLAGVTGYGTAVLFVFQGAPDLGLTQFLVETVSLVVFVLVLRCLPGRFSTPVLRSRRRWNLLLGVAMGALLATLSIVALAGRQHPPVSDAFGAAAQQAGGSNIVSIVLVDLRAWDTMGEISVLAVAATGVASLLFLLRRVPNAARHAPGPSVPIPDPAGDPQQHQQRWRSPPLAWARATAGVRARATEQAWLPGALAIPEERRSVVLEVLARMLFHTILLLSVYLLLTGHTSVGGGFAGGIVAGLALTVRYLAGGRFELYAASRLQPGSLIGWGLTIATGSALAAILTGHEVLTSTVVDLTLPVLGHVHGSTSLVFDLGVYLLVLGLLLDILRSLGARIDEQSEHAGRPQEVRP